MNGLDDHGSTAKDIGLCKVLFVIPRMGGGGAERVVSLLTKELAKKGFDVTLYTFVGGESFYPLHKDVRYKTAGAVLDKKSRLRRVVSELVFFPRVFAALRKEIDEGKYDVVVSFLQEADILVGLCRLTGGQFRYICSERNDPTKRGRMWAWALDHIYKMADSFVCQSKAVCDYYSIIPDSKKVIIANPVSDVATGFSVTCREKRVVAAGRLTEQKNFSLLIRSFISMHKQQPEYRLDIYGDGPLRNSLQKLIEDSGAADYITLQQPVKDVYRSIADAELFVLSSDYEGFPNVLLEAMAIGLPVVSTDFFTGTAREMITEENGVLVPVGDAAAMTRAMEKLLEDERLREQMRNNNRKKSQEYSALAIADQWIAAIRRVTCCNF